MKTIVTWAAAIFFLIGINELKASDPQRGEMPRRVTMTNSADKETVGKFKSRAERKQERKQQQQVQHPSKKGAKTPPPVQGSPESSYSDDKSGKASSGDEQPDVLSMVGSNSQEGWPSLQDTMKQIAPPEDDQTTPSNNSPLPVEESMEKPLASSQDATKEPKIKPAANLDEDVQVTPQDSQASGGGEQQQQEPQPIAEREQRQGGNDVASSSESSETKQSAVEKKTENRSSSPSIDGEMEKSKNVPIKRSLMGMIWDGAYYCGEKAVELGKGTLDAGVVVYKAANHYQSRMLKSRLERYVGEKPHLTFGMVLDELRGKHLRKDRTNEELQLLPIEAVIYQSPIVYASSGQDNSKFYLVGINTSLCSIKSDAKVKGETHEEKNKYILSEYLRKLEELEKHARAGRKVDENVFLEDFTVTTERTNASNKFFDDIMSFMFSFENVRKQFLLKYGDDMRELKRRFLLTNPKISDAPEFYMRHMTQNDVEDLKLKAEEVKKDIINWATDEPCYIDPRKGKGCFFPKSGSNCTVISPSFLVYNQETGRIMKLSFMYYRIKEEEYLTMDKDKLKQHFMTFRDKDFPAEANM